MQSQPLDDSHPVTFEQFSTHLRVNYRRTQLNKSYRFLKDERTSISIIAIHDYHEHLDEASFCPLLSLLSWNASKLRLRLTASSNIISYPIMEAEKHPSRSGTTHTLLNILNAERASQLIIKAKESLTSHIPESDSARRGDSWRREACIAVCDVTAN